MRVIVCDLADNVILLSNSTEGFKGHASLGLKVRIVSSNIGIQRLVFEPQNDILLTPRPAMKMFYEPLTGKIIRFIYL